MSLISINQEVFLSSFYVKRETLVINIIDRVIPGAHIRVSLHVALVRSYQCLSYRRKKIEHCVLREEIVGLNYVTLQESI